MSCPSCGKTLSAPDGAAGKRAKCPACGQIMIVPEVVRDAEEFSAPSPQPSTPFSPQPSAGPGQDWLDELQGPAIGSTPPGLGGEARRPCPECGEMIVVGAAKCRFCGAIFDPRLKVQAARRTGSQDDEQLSPFEWVICILCANIGCIVGIVYAVQGKPKGMKMVLISIAANVVGVILGVLVRMANAPHNFR